MRTHDVSRVEPVRPMELQWPRVSGSTVSVEFTPIADLHGKLLWIATLANGARLELWLETHGSWRAACIAAPSEMSRVAALNVHLDYGELTPQAALDRLAREMRMCANRALAMAVHVSQAFDMAPVTLSAITWMRDRYRDEAT